MDLLQKVIHALTQLHPPHPMFVHFPIGLTGAALFFMLLALWRRSDILEKVAFANISLAALSTIVAAVVGIRDNIYYFHGLAPNHIAKIILAVTLFVVTTATAFARWRYPELIHSRSAKVFYVLAYCVSFALAIVLGFLGGVIVYGI
jgi:uncharacterized membrane protein